MTELDYSARRKNCERFDALTRQIFKLDDNVSIGRLEEKLVNFSKARRGSALLGERLFFDLVRRMDVKNLLEVGGNDGRHTKLFLDETETTVHTFEPNAYAIKFYAELVAHPRLRFNPFGLSDTNGPAGFHVLKSYKGGDMEPVNGCSSFGGMSDQTALYETRIAMMCRGADYISASQLEPGYALWIDVEGYAAFAAEGFGDKLKDASFAICEIEVMDIMSTGANADRVVGAFESAGLEIVYRDFQNIGQCNVFAVNSTMVNEIRPFIAESLGKFVDGVGNASLSCRIADEASASAVEPVTLNVPAQMSQ